MKNLLILAACLIVGCAGPHEALVVKQYTLRNQDVAGGDDPLVRHEKLRRLYGAVSLEERKGRLGQYYTVIWASPNEGGLKREILFQFLQGGSGSRIKNMRRELPMEQAEGKEEFAVIGDDYFKNGRVLAWKMSLIVGGDPVATKQSYLWE
ncbi:MAG: hypothetical protein H7Y36_11895 [Armatimonadetes bacterium]|nr:hypothetical protein [Akkermansiaceae bacterium]